MEVMGFGLVRKLGVRAIIRSQEPRRSNRSADRSFYLATVDATMPHQA